MKREFDVVVRRTDVYKVIIDEDKLDKDLINEYEESMHKLEGDKIKQLAKEIGFMSMDNMNDYYEGIGYLKVDGFSPKGETEQGIEVETLSIEDYDTDIMEL